MDFSAKELEKYVENFSSAEDPLLKELDRETNLRVVQPRMMAGHIQGKLLELLTGIIAPRNVLEIGTFTGYSTLCIAAGLGDGAVVDTVEIDDELGSLSSTFFSSSPHATKIKQHTGSALDIVPRLGKIYDLVYIDGDKREYPAYYHMIMGGEVNGGHHPPMVKSGSVIIADNILWYGKVTEPVPHNDLHTRKIMEFNVLVASDPRVENVIIPIRDGISLIRVK